MAAVRHKVRLPQWVNRVGLTAYRRLFRSTLVNGHRQVGPAGPFRANSGHFTFDIRPGSIELEYVCTERLPK
jgi:hypothetical protein